MGAADKRRRTDMHPDVLYSHRNIELGHPRGVLFGVAGFSLPCMFFRFWCAYLSFKYIWCWVMTRAAMALPDSKYIHNARC